MHKTWGACALKWKLEHAFDLSKQGFEGRSSHEYVSRFRYYLFDTTNVSDFSQGSYTLDNNLYLVT